MQIQLCPISLENMVMFPGGILKNNDTSNEKILISISNYINNISKTLFL